MFLELSTSVLPPLLIIPLLIPSFLLHSFRCFLSLLRNFFLDLSELQPPIELEGNRAETQAARSSKLRLPPTRANCSLMLQLGPHGGGTCGEQLLPLAMTVAPTGECAEAAA